AARTTAGLGLLFERGFLGEPVDLSLAARARVDRDGVTDSWHLTHEVAIRAAIEGALLELAHRSAFSPPSFGDLFFREGFAVEANPDLRAERIPSELELGLRVGPSRAEIGARAWVGDVRDRIVWAPDFRFVWRPENVDVERKGAEAWLDVPLGPGPRLRLAYTYARATYDPATHPDPVQLVYRPRHLLDASLEWSPGAWSMRVDARRLGARTTAPTRENVLPAFWTVDLAVARRIEASRWVFELGLEIERGLDVTDSFVFGYPEPGRTVAARVAVRPLTHPGRSSKGSR
ncbi:MAG: TonB-dependent receptor, partial [Chloroflexi bacterium]|nr:TonB-dependent receptor [Chloroflexota bacterium]